MTLLASSGPKFNAVDLLVMAILAIVVFHRRLPDVMRRLRDHNDQNGPFSIP
jgi:hypothetical protein